MQKNKLIKNTFLLVLGGLITKVLGFVIKILYTRYLKDDGVSLITLVFPTYSLLLTISNFALPLAVTKFIAENKDRKSKILFNSFWITMIINILIISLFMFLSNSFSIYLLHDERASFLIKILCFTLPFVSTTSLIKAYYYGKEFVVPVIFSNISEEIIKLSLVIFFLPKMVSKGVMYGASFYLFINFICEVISFFTLSIFLPKKINIKKLEYRYDSNIKNRLLKISIPTLSGKLIGNIGYFLEPIILTNLLLYKGLDVNYIRLNYGYFEGYVIAILTIPSFFLNALSNNLIPVISKCRINKNINQIKKIIKKVFLMILIGGLLFISLMFIFGKDLMYLLYKTNNGYKYLKVLLPFFILFYLENPLMVILQSLNQEKNVFKITTYGIIIKYIVLILLIMLNIGFMSLIYSEIINILFVITLNIYYLRKYFSYFSQ
ncbi:MAG: oligosaccharide flippase family protein [Bacilli bacterium]|nr:oligosaccharide flippase family protein [Bacilli bacterium]